MMMMGEGMMHHKPTVDVPPWSLLDGSTAGITYPLPVSGVSSGLLNEAALAALQRYLPSNDVYDESDESELADAPVDAYSCDEFRMYEFKVRRCARGRSHDWTECPYAHPGEKARRRDPRKFHYSGTACPDFRKGNCKRGDSCEFAHGVFECWLHPARYRTQPCKDGTACRRRVCFFAHTPDQLRVLPNQQQSPKAATPESYDGSPLRAQQLMMAAAAAGGSPPMSPTAGETPPLSPDGSAVRRASWPVNEVLASLRKLQLGKVNSMPGSAFGMSFGSPRGGGGGFGAGFCSLPSTPTRALGGGVAASGGAGGWFEGFDEGFEEEPVERVESGRALRAKMYERLSREVEKAPDVGWVSELVK